MNLDDIAVLRLAQQHITRNHHATPKDLVAWMGAMQAQDYRMSRWAIGLRLPGIDSETVEKAIEKGEIVRTHVLRPTWHLVAGEDLRWMLALTSRHILSASAAQRRSLELDDQVLGKTTRIIEKALSGGRELTREELMQQIKHAGIVTDTHRAVHIMFEAELKAVVCSGTMRGTKLTYCLVDEKIPSAKILTREESLYTLAMRYFNSHGPATVHDFQWWSGLPAGDARKALEMIPQEMASCVVNEKVYWFPRDIEMPESPGTFVGLLPAFDEYLVSYKDRSASLVQHSQKDVITVNGIFKPVIVVDGKVVGTWKKTASKNNIKIELEIFDNAKLVDNDLLIREMQKTAAYVLS